MSMKESIWERGAVSELLFVLCGTNFDIRNKKIDRQSPKYEKD